MGSVGDEYDSERFPGNFYRGMIMKLDRVRGRGILRSHTGRDIPFQFPFVTVIGTSSKNTTAGIELLREGDSVGFDVSYTSRGLRVSVIKPALRESGGQDSGGQ